MEADPTEAGNVMKKFLEILENDASLDSLRKQLGSSRIMETYTRSAFSIACKCILMHVCICAYSSSGATFRLY